MVDEHIANMTAGHVRAARGLLKLSATDLADRCGVSRSTIVDFESGKSAQRARGLNKANRIALARYFWEVGIEFIGGTTPGLIVRKPELLD